jgi:hypothetical protein
MPETLNIRPILERVRLFERNRAQYKVSTYDEANTRIDFVDKLFECLGWDIANAQVYEKALSMLKSSEIHGFITPSSVLFQSSYSKLRKIMLCDYYVRNIVKLPDKVSDTKVRNINGYKIQFNLLNTYCPYLFCAFPITAR